MPSLRRWCSPWTASALLLLLFLGLVSWEPKNNIKMTAGGEALTMPETNLGPCDCCNATVPCSVCAGTGIPSSLVLTVSGTGSCDGSYSAIYNSSFGSWYVSNINGCPGSGDTFIEMVCDEASGQMHLYLANRAMGPYPASSVSCGPPFSAQFTGIDLDSPFSPSCCPGATSATLTFTE